MQIRTIDCGHLGVYLEFRQLKPLGSCFVCRVVHLYRSALKVKMLVVLYLIACSLTVGAHIPETTRNYTDESLRLIDFLSDYFVSTMNGFKETAIELSMLEESSPGKVTEKGVEIISAKADKYSRVFLKWMNMWKEYVLNNFTAEDPPSSSREYPDGFAQSSLGSSPAELHTTEFADTTSFTTSQPGSITKSVISEEVEVVLDLIALVENIGEAILFYALGLHKKDTSPPEDLDDSASLLSRRSMRGIPGVHYPDYADIPITSFSCFSKPYIPGLYADLETGCQVFHVCWPHKRESFLCPIGTTFNQAILACDYFYSSNCSLASSYYDVNSQSRLSTYDEGSKTLSMIDVLLGREGKLEEESPEKDLLNLKADLSSILKFLPVKAKVIIFPETGDDRSEISESSVGKGKKTQEIGNVTETSSAEALQPVFIPVAEYRKTSADLKSKIVSTSANEKAAHARRGLSLAVSIVQNVLNFTGRILQRVRGIHSSAYSAKLSQPSQTHKSVIVEHLPLMKLDPRFITKPVDVPEMNIQHEKTDVQAPTAEVSSTHSGAVDASTQTSRTVQTVSKSRKLAISDATKEILVRNYIRLLIMKMR